MADEQEDRALRRLLKVLEQGIGTGAFEIVDRIDQDHAARGHAWRHCEQRLEGANLRDRDRAGAILAGLVRVFRRTGKFAVIGVRPRRDQAARIIVGWHVETGRQWRARRALRQQAQRRDPRERPFTDPLRPREQPGVVQRATLHRRGEGGMGGCVAQR